MSKWLSLLLLFSTLSGLELSVQGGKEQNSNFSTIHLKDDNPFLCEVQKNDFDREIEIICAFDRRPSETFKALNNNFFTIAAETRGKNFFMVITPHERMKLFPIAFDLKHDDSVFEADVKRSRHWMVVGYKEALPMIRMESRPPTGINFPVEDKRHITPYVGGLDIKGNPIHMSRIKDVSEYIALKRFYKAKDYEKTLEVTDRILETYPDTLFKSELLVYQMRCYHHLKKFEEIIAASKQFLRVHSSDENVPEILAYTADAYVQIGLYIDADYFFDRLFTEHESSAFAKLGLIFKGDQLSAAGNSKKSVVYYEQALHESLDVDVASRAAFNLAKYYIERGMSEKAASYIDKIADANRKYFGEHPIESFEVALSFANRNQFAVAARIAGALLEKMSRIDERYEMMFKDYALWLAESDDKEAALEALNRYLKEYSYGNFREEVIRVKDALFFEESDANLTTRIAEYDDLILKYEGDAIAQKALYKKAELFYENGYFQEVLDLNASLAALDIGLYPDAPALVKDSARGLMQEALEHDQCADVILISRRYNIKLSEKWDEGIYKCAMMAGDYALARATASAHLLESDIGLRMAWLERTIKTDFATGNYTNVISRANELLELAGVEKTQEYDGVNRTLFDAEQRIGSGEGMINAIKRVEGVYGENFEDIQRYTQMVTLGQKRKDDRIIENYATKVMRLQEKTGSFTQSPYIEFTLVRALLNSAKEAEALNALQTLERQVLTPEQRARQKYLLGTLLQKAARPQEAKKAYEASLEADATSAWGKLASDALDLME